MTRSEMVEITGTTGIFNSGETAEYKKFEAFLGGSDVAALTVRGSTADGIKAQAIRFGGDGSYKAWVVADPALIPAHYFKAAEFRDWMDVIDDQGVTLNFKAAGKTISVWRAGEMGCLICVGGVADGKVSTPRGWDYSGKGFPVGEWRKGGER